MIDVPKIPGITPIIADKQSVGQVADGGRAGGQNTLYTARVINQTPQGNTTLQLTQAGQALETTVNTNLSLNRGAELALRFLAGNQTAGSHFQAKIEAINNQPLTQAQQQQQTVIRGTLLPATSAPSQPVSVNVSQSAPVQAVIVTPEPARGLPNQPPLQTGDVVTARILNAPPAGPNQYTANVVGTEKSGEVVLKTPLGTIKLPAGTNLEQGSNVTVRLTPPSATATGVETKLTVQAGQQVAAIPLTPNAQPNPALPANATLTPTDKLILHVLSSQLPNNPASPSAPAVSSNPAFTATVIGQEGSQAIVKTSLGTLKLASSTPLPQGTTLQLEVVSHTATQSLAVKSDALTAILAQRYPQLFTQNASIFQELASALTTLNIPQTSAIPQLAGNQSAASLLWFLSAFMNNKGERYPPAEIRTQLEAAGRTELLTKLDSAVQSLSARFAEPSPQGWQSLLFPFYDGEVLHHGELHMRKQKQGADDEKRKKDLIHFIVSVSLERYGDIQLDGMVRRGEERAELSLVVRSKKDLSPQMQQDIRKLFEGSNELTGIGGSIQFHKGDFPFDPAHEGTHQAEIVA